MMKRMAISVGLVLVLFRVVFMNGSIFAQTVPMDTSTDTTMTETTPSMPEGPSVGNITVTDITDTSARINIDSDELVQGYVEYGTTEQYGMSTPLTSEFSTTPSFLLENLSPETLYHYRVIVMDSAGNAAITADETFTTLATPEPETPPTATEAPQTISLSVSNTETVSVSTSTARITWKTNKDADSQVEYGTTNTYGTFSPIGVSSLSHTVNLSDLNPSTKYYYRAISKTPGETAYGTAQQFTTLAVQSAPTPPIISNVVVSNIGTDGVIISWTTSKPSTSNIQYGTTTSYSLLVGKDSALVTSHSRTVSGLISGTLYHFRVISSDNENNTALGKDRTFTTNTASSGSSNNTAATTTPATPTTSKPSNSDILANIEKLASGALSSQGGGLPVIPTRPLLLEVVPLDGKVLFEWRKDRGVKNGVIHTIILKKQGTDPVRSRIDGDIIYDGPSTTFTDTDVENGKEYHYALYSYGAFGRFTSSSNFKVIPIANREQVNISTLEIENSPSLLSLSRNLFKGLQGDDIKSLQRFLFVNGYYSEGLITGYFGQLTKLAVMRFQKLNNIFPTSGYVGPITKTILAQ